jgi:hypothetical protein
MQARKFPRHLATNFGLLELSKYRIKWVSREENELRYYEYVSKGKDQGNKKGFWRRAHTLVEKNGIFFPNFLLWLNLQSDTTHCIIFSGGMQLLITIISYFDLYIRSIPHSVKANIFIVPSNKFRLPSYKLLSTHYSFFASYYT